MNLKVKKNCYGQKPEDIIVNDNAMILWDSMVQYDHTIKNRKPDNVFSF